ncbi:hypothetical protein KGF54_003335 [Candida jiufengensis]|uniref:uncharacterized protein n=1 Tax=Candida jiufengensis TaxID=497108 RepID=UPI002224B698|nr:uncharacterized protein KGF54_003335 [Candida jiufengensis]KAI5952468.1 hypothetical protein KGF54_003335 [Candida jiufengensis]
MNDGVSQTNPGSPNTSISPPTSRITGDSTLSTLSTISQTSTTSTTNSSRRVARRACLSCREKKIKCDGEPVSSITSADGINKIIPEKTRICSNCKFLDIKCIFVQSNRGGRRKRKDLETGEILSIDAIKKSKMLNNNNNNTQEEKEDSSIERVSSFILDNENSRKKLSSPVPSTTTTYEKPKIDTRSSSIDYSRTTLESPESRYLDPRDPRGPSSGGPPHFHHGPPFPFRHPPPHHHGPPSFGHHHHDFPPGPPPHHGPPHHHPHGPPPPHHLPHQHHFQHRSDSTSENQLPLPSLTNSYPSNSSHFPPRQPPHHKHFHPPPHHHLHPHGPPPHHHPGPPPHVHNRFFNGFDQQQSDLTESYDNSYYDSTPPMDKQSNTNSEISYRSGITTSNDSPKSQTDEAPFSDHELAKYELPKWNSLNILIDYYYIYNQPSHQMFPGKQIFLKNISLNVDSSILHIMIATICILANRKNPNLNINSDESYWVGQMEKYWDNLNGFGIMACFRLLAKCTSFRFNMYRVNQCNIKIFETIYDNNYIEIYSQKRFEFKENGTKNSLFGTSRQCYERETILRLIWTFYINHIILLRFNQGRPYYKLSSILDDFKFDYERDHYSNNILLPLNDIDFMTLKLVNNRTSWKQLYERNHIPSDLSSLILASKIFENLLSKLSNDDLTFDNLISSNSFNINFAEKISNQHINIIDSKKLIVINITYWFANLILRVGEVLQYNFFIYEVMKFKMCKYEFRRNTAQQQDTTKDLFTPLICDEFLDTNNLTQQLQNFKTNQWISLIELTKALSGFVSLLEICPSKEYNHYSVVVGPTSITNLTADSKSNFRDVISNPIEWYDAPELQSTVKESWNKFPQYTLSFSTAFLSVACSLAVLTKYLRLSSHTQNKNLIVELIETGEIIEIPHIVDGWISKNFNSINLSSKVSSLCEFIKYKLYYSNEEVMHDSVKRMNKLTQHLEEILSR